MLNNVLVGVAAVAAIVGLRQWRLELKGKAQFELASKIVLLVNQFRDEFRDAVMNPPRPLGIAMQPVPSSRFDGDEERLDEIQAEEHKRHSSILRLRDLLRRMDAARWEAEFILSPDDAALLGPFVTAWRKQDSSITRYFQYLRYAVRPDLAGRLPTPEEVAELEDTVFGMVEDMPVFKMIDDAIEVLKREYAKYVR